MALSGVNFVVLPSSVFIFTLLVLFSYSVSSALVFKGNETDRLALLDLKTKVTDDPLGIMQLWNGTIHFCKWYGVTCGLRHQRVTILNLRSCQLSGHISPHVGNLTFLRILVLQNNSFSHQIPREISRLRRLRRLSLSNNSLTGEIPPNISSCSKISLVNLAFNNLVGEIPKEFGSLSMLQVISLQRNHLSGMIPSSLGNLSFLQVFSAPENFLTGTIPEALGQLKNLSFFSLGANSLSGTIPSSVFNLSSIITFNVVQNQLQGRLPIDIGNTLPNLQLFSIAKNDFTGIIPASINNATNLQWLPLADNQLSGSVPSMDRLYNLQVLSLSANNLGNMGATDLRFLESLINSTNLWLVDFGNNRLGGVLPEFISNFSSTLARLSFGENYIHGKIPSGISSLVNLERLEMFNNDLSGHIPSDIGKLQKLVILSINQNQLSGTIPFSIGNLTSLIELRLSNNNLEGSLPPSLGDCVSLSILDLSNNSLKGTIPAQVLIGLSSLSIFMDLSANSFTGSIPLEVGNLKNIGELGISDNKLSGKIPDSLGACVRLEVLVLQNNFLDGPIPSSLRSLRGIREFDFSSNNLSGPIPEFLKTFDSLQSLNLSYNNFEGMVPEEGIFKNSTSVLLMGNGKLCGGKPEFNLPKCNFIQPKKRRMAPLVKIILSTVCVLFGLSFTLTFILFFLMRKRSKDQNVVSHVNSLMNVSYQSLLRATDRFSSANLIGVGSFGPVYKGNLDEEGGGILTIAVKVLDHARVGASKSFAAECRILKNIRHRNLVKVLTACSGTDYGGNDFKALVYEFMTNGSLEEWLHPIPRPEAEDEPPRKRLNLVQRLNIGIDIACALDYLHHECGGQVVHCDLKPGNVLLDDEMNGHVSDFGIAKFLSTTRTASFATQSSSIGVRGTIGYTPPEYGVGSEVSTSGDVYSYGILLLEMFTGKRPTDDMFKEDETLHNYADIAFPEQAAEIADPLLLDLQETGEGDSDGRNERIFECLHSVFRIGVSCSSNWPRERMEINHVVTQLGLIKNKFASYS